MTGIAGASGTKRVEAVQICQTLARNDKTGVCTNIHYRLSEQEQEQDGCIEPPPPPPAPAGQVCQDLINDISHEIQSTRFLHSTCPLLG